MLLVLYANPYNVEEDSSSNDTPLSFVSLIHPNYTTKQACHSPTLPNNTSLNNNNVNPLNMMQPVNQKSAPDQSFPLSTECQTSSIPMATEDGTAQFWRYPSQPMFWNAMLRKGWRWKNDGDVCMISPLTWD
uniref:Holocytochrome c-type synthase n=1 Tax=Glossina austeni TaxID=7395 RepID=A0A1A9UZ48_GLOAU